MSWKRPLNVGLLLLGIGVVVYYQTCGQSCTFLRGDVFGVDLAYLGIAFCTGLIIINLAGHERLNSIFLSAAMGTEAYLVGFQMKAGVYCPYCLAFAAILFLLFLINFSVSRKLLVIVFFALGLLFFSLFFRGATVPVLAADETLVPTFGTGKIQVRIYTDYFCGPCSKLEPRIDQLLPKLIQKNKITVTFIDTPVHSQTMLYARYFLYILKEKSELKYILHARAILFQAAKSGINEKEKLEEFLQKKKIRFRPFDTKPTYAVLNAYLAQDRIDRTPTCVIYDGDKKGVYKGEQEIVQALELL
jgi:thiol:disulfide interchange protein DsbA